TFCFALGSMFLSLLAATGTVDVVSSQPASAEGSPATTGYVSIDIRPHEPPVEDNATGASQP
ncbi:hypothetical protein KY327_02880, partial [Candidatus Woesearchaeota archaeon]|nr:hypothetical protein [Candidatus Woesearchaeota archaeon]